MIGLIGKPSSGKSTFFNAATELNVKTAPYPFTTIDPNIGITWIRIPCPHQEKGRVCEPSKGFCIMGNRFVPVKITDIAGLVPGAHEGRGMGNKFLDQIRQEKVYIHVVDASGRTDMEGNEGEGNPVEEVAFLERELRLWIKGIVEKALEKVRNYPPEEREERLIQQLSAFGSLEISYDMGIEEIVDRILKGKKRVIVANKVDIPSSEEWVKELQKRYGDVIPTSSLSELILRRAAKSGYIDYIPGDDSFRVLKPLSPQQEKALSIAEEVLSRWSSTGVQRAINEAVLSNHIVVFPVQNEHNWTDSAGRVLPDAIILEKGSTPLDLAEKIHSDLAKHFVAAIDARKLIRIPKDQPLNHLDVIKIVSAR